MRRIVGKCHICSWPDCRRPVPLDMWGCKPHWFTLPKEIRDEIWQGYRRAGKLSPEWLAANEQALEWIRGMPERIKAMNVTSPQLPSEGGLDVNSDAARR